eukprot:gene9452-10441_t
MDAFVIKKEKPQQKRKARVAEKKKYKQVTIKALPRVVVVEDIQRLAVTLNEEHDNVNSMLSALRELKAMKPSREIILSTKIGHRINFLQQHENEAVKSLAREVLRDWNRFYKEQRKRETLEVRSDAKSELLRMKARKLLADSLNKQVTDMLPELTERNIYRTCGRRPDNNYEKKVRKLCFTLKSNESTRLKIIEGRLSIDDFCKQGCD